MTGGQVAAILAALVGIVGVLTGVSLTAAPARTAASVGMKAGDAVTRFYARTCGLRNLAAGALFLAGAYALGVPHTPAGGAVTPQAVEGLGIAWAAVQAGDTVLFWSVRSRPGAIGAAVLAIASAAVAALMLGR